MADVKHSERIMADARNLRAAALHADDYESCVATLAIALTLAEQRGAESAKAEAQPAGTGWVIGGQPLSVHLAAVAEEDPESYAEFRVGFVLELLQRLAGQKPTPSRCMCQADGRAHLPYCPLSSPPPEPRE